MKTPKVKPLSAPVLIGLALGVFPNLAQSQDAWHRSGAHSNRQPRVVIVQSGISTGDRVLYYSLYGAQTLGQIIILNREINAQREANRQASQAAQDAIELQACRDAMQEHPEADGCSAKNGKIEVYKFPPPGSNQFTRSNSGGPKFLNRY